MSKLHGFRRATLADASEVQDITRKAYTKWVSIINREPGPMKADYKKAILEHLVELYEECGVVHGVIELIPIGRHLLIENVAVLPGSQGRGIGGALLKQADFVAASLDLPELRLYTNAMFTDNISYYAKRGYEEFKRAPIPTGGTAVHMRKTRSGA